MLRFLSQTGRVCHMKSRKGAGYPGTLPRPPHEVNKRHRLSKGSPPPSTRSRQKTQVMRHDIYQLRVSFSGGARPGSGPAGGQWPGGRRWAARSGSGEAGRRAETGQRRPAHEHKNAVGRRECTGPQPFGQNTSLNLNSAQLSSSSRPNHT